MLQLNREKTEFFVAASSHIKNQMPFVKLAVSNETIEPSAKVRNLGVIFDTSMTMCNQISSLSRNVTFHLRNISRIRRFLDFESCDDIILSLILSRLDYGNVLLWVPTPLISHASKLFKIGLQNSFFFVQVKRTMLLHYFVSFIGCQ